MKVPEIRTGGRPLQTACTVVDLKHQTRTKDDLKLFDTEVCV